MEVEEKRQGLPAFRETASSETLDLVLPLVLHLGGDAEVSKGTEKTTAPPPPPSPPPHNPFSGFGSTSQQMSNMLAANQAAWAAVQARLAKLTTSADATASLKSIVTAWHLANRWDAAVAMEAIGEHLLEYVALLMLCYVALNYNRLLKESKVDWIEVFTFWVSLSGIARTPPNQQL